MTPDRRASSFLLQPDFFNASFSCLTQGDVEGARAHYREALQIKETIASKLTNPDFKESYLKRTEVKEISEALLRSGDLQ